MLHRMILQIKVSSDRLRCVFVVFLYVAKMFSESVAKNASKPVTLNPDGINERFSFN